LKKIYVIIFFLVFFNIFSFLFAIGGPLNIFPYSYGTGNPSYNITTGDNMSSQQVAENATGYTFDNALSLFFVNLDLKQGWNILFSVGILVGAALAAWVTKSPAPLVVGFIGNLMKNTYVNNMSIFNELPINSYIMLAVGVGMILLFIMTCAEYMTSGHGEV